MAPSGHCPRARNEYLNRCSPGWPGQPGWIDLTARPGPATRPPPPELDQLDQFKKSKPSRSDSFWLYSGATVQPGVDEGLFGEIDIYLSPAACWARAVDPSPQLYSCVKNGKSALDQLYQLNQYNQSNQFDRLNRLNRFN